MQCHTFRSTFTKWYTKFCNLVDPFLKNCATKSIFQLKKTNKKIPALHINWLIHEKTDTRRILKSFWYFEISYSIVQYFIKKNGQKGSGSRRNSLLSNWSFLYVCTLYYLTYEITNVTVCIFVHSLLQCYFLVFLPSSATLGSNRKTSLIAWHL